MNEDCRREMLAGPAHTANQADCALATSDTGRLRGNATAMATAGRCGLSLLTSETLRATELA